MRMQRDFTYVDDIASGIVACLDNRRIRHFGGTRSILAPHNATDIVGIADDQPYHFF